tara:strand:- start:2917 stop:3099 length:183 start_codon:yes stop_codon:yes gene_type:complete
LYKLSIKKVNLSNGRKITLLEKEHSESQQKNVYDAEEQEDISANTSFTCADNASGKVQQN